DVIHIGARLYHYPTARFLSADPLGHASDMSLYSYANNDPVNGVDPSGRFFESMGANEAFGNAPTGSTAVFANQLNKEFEVVVNAFIETQKNVVLYGVGVLAGGSTMSSVPFSQAGVKAAMSYAGAGASVNVAITGAKDIAGGDMGWKDYTSSAVSGAMSGLTYMVTRNPGLSSAAGAYNQNTSSSLLTGESIDPIRLTLETGLSYGLGMRLSYLNTNPFTSLVGGTGGVQAVANRATTMTMNEAWTNMSAITATKIGANYFTSEISSGAIENIVLDMFNHGYSSLSSNSSPSVFNNTTSSFGNHK
ncbi:MAG: RHS repeat-associated core domain-containing protein, partial [Methylacidiphilales bacterium]|nr:RHS repeat-associated core domain-containing protein [Candidatus Methylacidiphilales bacterium]